MLRRRPSGRALIWLGVILLGVAVVLIGLIGAIQAPSQSSATCQGADTCTAANEAWPTGWGWWTVIGVAAVAIITITAGVIVKAVDKRHPTTR